MYHNANRFQRKLIHINMHDRFGIWILKADTTAGTPLAYICYHVGTDTPQLGLTGVVSEMCEQTYRQIKRPIKDCTNRPA